MHNPQVAGRSHHGYKFSRMFDIGERDPSCHVLEFMTLLPEPRIAEDIPQCVTVLD